MFVVLPHLVGCAIKPVEQCLLNQFLKIPYEKENYSLNYFQEFKEYRLQNHNGLGAVNYLCKMKIIRHPKVEIIS